MKCNFWKCRKKSLKPICTFEGWYNIFFLYVKPNSLFIDVNSLKKSCSSAQKSVNRKICAIWRQILKLSIAKYVYNKNTLCQNYLSFSNTFSRILIVKINRKIYRTEVWNSFDKKMETLQMILYSWILKCEEWNLWITSFATSFSKSWSPLKIFGLCC